MNYIVKRGPGCNGLSCVACEMYLSGFISKDGGITVQQNPENARLTEEVCAQKCIEIQECKE